MLSERTGGPPSGRLEWAGGPGINGGGLRPNESSLIELTGEPGGRSVGLVGADSI